ncbi:MAG: EamA family transporter [Candidatus Berkelbacteria bacterium]
MIAAILSSIGYAGSVILDKFVLSISRMPIKIYVALIFIILAILSLIFLPFFGHVDFAQMNISYIGIFVAMIAIAVIWNILYCQSMQKENLHEYELIMLISPLATIIFAEIFFPSERNLGVSVAAGIASITFVLSRLRGHHIALSMTAKRTVLAMLLMSFESILFKELLNVFSPVALYFARTAVIALVFAFMYKPNFGELHVKPFLLVLGSGLFAFANMVLKLYGFDKLGIVETTMLLLLGPLMVYGFSYFYFRERQHYKYDMACAIVVVLCIIYTVVIK